VEGVAKFGFDAAQAAEARFVVNAGIDAEAFLGIGWAVPSVIPGGFVEHDLRSGENGVL
jgi:hypothetical protein